MSRDWDDPWTGTTDEAIAAAEASGKVRRHLRKVKHCPEGYRPQEVCQIRDTLVADLDGDMGDLLHQWSEIAGYVGRLAPTSPEVELQGFDSARLFWVPPEETAAIIEGAKSLPDDLVLDVDMLPALSGFVVFGADWHGIDANTGQRAKFPIRAMRWGPVNLIDPDAAERRAGIAISSYSTTRGMNRAMRLLQDDEIKTVVENMGFIPDQRIIDDIRTSGEKPDEEKINSWLPLGRSDWLIGDNWKQHPIFDENHTAYTSMIEDRCVLAALWALMESCPPHEHVPSRAERRQAARRGTEAAPVRVVTWRGPQGQRLSEGESQGTGHKMTKRFPVRSHWRHQAYGPGRTLRKWILVPAHWRGPEDGEIGDAHEIVHKVVGP